MSLAACLFILWIATAAVGSFVCWCCFHVAKGCHYAVIFPLDERNTGLYNAVHSIEYTVEADSFAAHKLWSRVNRRGGTWNDLGGFHIRVGLLAQRPICINIMLIQVDGVTVGFYDACSELVDYSAIVKWLSLHCLPLDFDGRPATCNAENFHNCERFIREKRTRASSGT